MENTFSLQDIETITLYFNKNADRKDICFRQNDKDSRFIKAKIFNDNEQVTDFKNVTLIKATFIKPDKTCVYIDVDIPKAGQDYILLPITTNTLAVPGVVTCSISLINSTQKLTTGNWLFRVIKSLENDPILSSNEWAELEEMRNRLNELLDLEFIYSDKINAIENSMINFKVVRTTDMNV